jgi:UDP-N-acetylglucosamine 2-epimerase (hydrolysing)
MMLGNKKKIIFLTGTRADYGKLKPLINAVNKNKKFQPIIIITGMHLKKKYGSTYVQIENDFKNIKKYKINNYHKNDNMDIILSNTIKYFGKIIKKIKPDLVVIHGDRVETLAATIHCNFNNILTCHIEGGEVSGTVDESIRHATTKLSHVHFVSNAKAKNILKRMGEVKKNIYIIGSPEVDIMIGKNLPLKKEVQKRYNIKFEKYAIFLFHPVTTLMIKDIEKQCKILFNVLIKSSKNYVVILPNNDTFSSTIFNFIKKLRIYKNIKILPSLRFEYYLTLLKNSEFIIGNSSSGIREASVYGIKTINLGERQKNRADNNSIKNLQFNEEKILKTIKDLKKPKNKKKFIFGSGGSAKKFINVISKKSFWNTDRQKHFAKN